MTREGKSFFQRILLPLDGSASSLKAADYALALARQQGCGIVALHVVDEQVAEEMARFADRPLEAILEQMRRSGIGYLEALQRRCGGTGRVVRTEVRVGNPHQVILEVAASEGADLIVMGKVGRRGPRRVLIGSVTERVIEQSSRPVLVVK